MIITALGIVLIWVGTGMLLLGTYQLICTFVATQMIKDEHKASHATVKVPAFLFHGFLFLTLVGTLLLVLL